MFRRILYLSCKDESMAEIERFLRYDLNDNRAYDVKMKKGKNFSKKLVSKKVLKQRNKPYRKPVKGKSYKGK
jgi:hypothetical protein